MQLTKYTQIFFTLLLIANCLVIPLANAEPGEGDRKRGGPPPEAIAACVSANAQDQCRVTTRRGDELSGHCLAPPQVEQLACVPDGHQRGGQGEVSREGSPG